MMEATPAAPADELELNCPLCGYDLRGLPTHRCPECGHAFDPEKLRLAKLEHREWFFEDARRRHIRAFLATTFASLRPIKFWGVVAAAHQIMPVRLIIWSTAWLFTAFSMVITAAGVVIARQASLPVAPILVPGSGQPLVLSRAQPLGSGAPWIRAPVQPLRPVVNDWYDWIAYLYDAQGLYSPLVTLALALAWPLLAILILQLFGTTLRKGGIHAGHLWRCTLYALPLMVIPAACFAALCCFVDQRVFYSLTQSLFDELPKFVPQMIDLFKISRPAALVLGWCALISTVHLAAAHVRYLRLPQAIVQALLVQTVVWLVMIMLLIFGAEKL